MKLKFVALMALLSMLLVSCGGGGGSTSTGGSYYSHSSLASEFVYRLNVDLGYDVQLVKTNTEQYDYIVVYDYDYDTYDAYYIGNYNVGESLSNYVLSYDHKFYFDLNGPDIWNDYQDPITGLIFEQTSPLASVTDAGKVANVKNQIKVEKFSEKLQAQYQFSAARADEISRLTLSMSEIQKKRPWNKADVVNFANALAKTDTEKFATDIESGSATLADFKKVIANNNDVSVEAIEDMMLDAQN